MEIIGNQESTKYSQLGVSAAKGEVFGAISSLPRGIVPNAFCKVVEDVFSNDPDYCVLSHADGAGTKSILAYLHYRLYGQPDAFKGIAQDAIVMNLDDALCVGASSGFSLSTIVSRNAKRIPGAIIKAIIEGSQEFIERMNKYGVSMTLCGGETADVGDVVRTALVDSVIATRMRREFLIRNEIKPDQTIVSLASGGDPCAYEDSWNSGIASNGLTAARHVLLGANVREKYQEAFDDALDPSLAYTGPYDLENELPGTKKTILEALLSPTRTFAPVIKTILKELFPHISGLVHCTSGAQTKSLRFGQGIAFHKDIGNDIPEIFREIKRISGMSWGEMAKIFNMGYRMEIYCSKDIVEDVVSIADSFKVKSRIIGNTRTSATNHNQLTLKIAGEECKYQINN